MANFDDICKDVINLSKSLEEEGKKFLLEQAGILKKKTLRIANNKIKKKTGNYIKSLKRGRVFTFEGNVHKCSVFSYAPHAHLIEYGHKMLDKNKNSTKLEKVKGKEIFKEAREEFSKEFEENTEKKINEIFEKNGF